MKVQSLSPFAYFKFEVLGQTSLWATTKSRKNENELAHLRICVLVFLVRLNVWLNKVRNNIQIFRLIFLRIFNCNMTFSFKMTPILLKIVLILMDRLRIDIWISQNTLRVKLVVLVRAYRHLLFNTILHLTLEPWFSIWIFLVHRCFFETILS